MGEDVPQKLDNVIQIDESKIQEHLGELVRNTVEEALNKFLDVEGVKEDKAGWSCFLRHM